MLRSELSTVAFLQQEAFFIYTRWSQRCCLDWGVVDCNFKYLGTTVEVFCSVGGVAMGLIRARALCVLVCVLTGCSAPGLVLFEDPSLAVAPSGPTVAALVANLKCELWEAANDTQVLPYYLDLPELPLHPPMQHPSVDREFNLKNLFVEIEYVGDIKLTLQVTDTGALNPSANFIQPLAAANTNLTLAVGGQISAQGDRFIDIYQSVDFARLVPSPENPLYTAVRKVPGPRGQPGFHEDKPFPKLRDKLARAPDESNGSPCDRGALLAGRLGLKESLASYAISAAMQDVAVLLSPAAGSSSGGSGASSGGTLYGQQISLTGFSGYAYGQMDTQIDFTITLGVNGGPNWTLTKFKGPNVTSAAGSNGQGLLNVSRLAKDTALVTIIPVCIRPKYFPEPWSRHTAEDLANATAPPTGYNVSGTLKDGKIAAAVTQTQPAKNLLSLSYPVDKYLPEMIFGTPAWANYLPPCLSAAGQAALSAAPGAARTNNQLLGIPNLIVPP